MSALSVFCLWAPASTSVISNELTKRTLFVTYVILYGITSGTYVSLLPPVLFDLVGPVGLPDPCYLYSAKILVLDIYPPVSNISLLLTVPFTFCGALEHLLAPHLLVHSSKADADQVQHHQRGSCKLSS